MNYIGSKKTLSKTISNYILSSVDNTEDKIFCDIFAGTGAISIELKNSFKKIIANDLEHYSHILLEHYIGLNEQINFDLPNNLEPIEGKIYNYYAKDRMYFTPENAKKIDAVRTYLKTAKDNKHFCYYLTSLLEAADKVANTASVYAAYLKQFKKTALKEIEIVPAKIYPSKTITDVFRENANDLIRIISGDVLYLDPPYNERQYASNYHVLNTIAEYRDFEPQGITGLPPDWNRSDYSSRRNAVNAFEDLIDNADFEHIFLSYNNFGILDVDYIKQFLSTYGKLNILEVDYKPFKSREISKEQNDTKEYVFYLNKLG